MARRPGHMATLIVTMAAVALAVAPAHAGAARDAVTEQLSQRLFPLFDAVGRNHATLSKLKDDPAVAPMLDVRLKRRTACADDPLCTANALLWTPAEAATLSHAAASLTNLAAPDDGLSAQVGREVAGVNIILRSYGLGGVPAYPDIDGAGAIEPRERQARLQAAQWLAQMPREGSAQALDPSIDYALALLDASDRTDAIGYEPRDGSVNAAAMRRAKSIDWNSYRYTALIVTGVGPEVDGMAVSPFGKYHVRLAAERFARGEAPFIVITGGRAHPRATPFAEAEQMRKALIDRFGVPAEAIVIEPYARHTTTNLRNAARLLLMMGAPLDRDALIVCNPGQSAMIESAEFVRRNADELGYQPGVVGARLSPTELLFRPSPMSNRVDPRDPLDP
jgi:hypothetical protein